MVAQENIYKAISDAEKTVFSVTTYNNGGGIIGKSAGFFIGSIGLAVCRASIFKGADSIKITDSRNLGLTIERVVAVHQPADLVIIKLSSVKRFRFDFLFPTTALFHENEEMLIFSDPTLGSDGAILERISRVIDKPILNRIGLLKSNLTASAYGAPVLNSKGELVGIVGHFKPESPSFLFNCSTLSDTNWYNLNVPIKKLKESILKQAYLAPDLSKALVAFAFDDWIGTAKNLTSHLKVFNNNAMFYAMRGYARYMYNNKSESKIDFNTAKLFHSNSYLTFYFESLVAVEEQQIERAYILADSSVYFQPKFAFSRTLRGNLTLETDRPINDALLDFSYAIQTNPTFAEGYYRRFLYLRKYTQNFDLAYSDISQCVILDPSLPNIYLLKSQMDIEKENFFEAQKNLNSSLAKNPSNEIALCTRGLVNYQLGLRREACTDWKKASDLGNERAMGYLLKYCNSTSSH